MDLGFCEPRRFIQVHELGCEPRCRPETAALDHVPRQISRFLFELSDRALPRIFARMQRARRDFHELAACRMSILPDEDDFVGRRARHHAHRSWMDHDLSRALMSGRLDDSILTDLDVSSAVDNM